MSDRADCGNKSFLDFKLANLKFIHFSIYNECKPSYLYDNAHLIPNGCVLEGHVDVNMSSISMYSRLNGDGWPQLIWFYPL